MSREDRLENGAVRLAGDLHEEYLEHPEFRMFEPMDSLLSPESGRTAEGQREGIARGPGPAMAEQAHLDEHERVTLASGGSENKGASHLFPENGGIDRVEGVFGHRFGGSLSDAHATNKAWPGRDASISGMDLGLECIYRYSTSAAP